MKKRKSFFVMLFVSIMLACLLPTAVSAARENDGLTLGKNGRYCYYENGKKVKKAWRTVNGKKYYFQSTGWSTPYSLYIDGKVYVFNSKSQLHRPSKRSIFKSKGYYYCVNPDGTADTGWLIYNNRLYKAYSKSGRFAVNKTENGIRFGKNGAAVNNTPAKLKMKTMKIVSQITNKGMSKSQKLRACWNYIVHGGRFSYYLTEPNIWKKGWQQEIALSMLTKNRGDCNGFACAFAALAAEVGYTPYVISGRVPGNRDGAADGLTRHCWVKINGNHYDPEGTWANWAGYVYGASGYPMDHTITQTINFKTYV